MSTTLCTFNVNNMFLRYQFSQTPPGSMSKQRLSRGKFFFLPKAQKEYFDMFNPQQRQMAATAIRRGGTETTDCPDILCLQEVECMQALRAFSEMHLGNAYPYALLIDSHDERLIDVGLLSKRPILSIRTHIDDRHQPKGQSASEYVFSRDCLEVEIDPKRKDGRTLTVLINHFKSKMALGKTPQEKAAAAQRANERRRMQAEAVQSIIQTRWPGEAFGRALFAVVGDFNDQPDSPWVQPLTSQAGLVQALARIPKPEDRWTYCYSAKKTVSQIDHILLSPALDTLTRGILPVIEHRGISTKGMGPGARKPLVFEHVDDDKNPIPVASDFPRFPGVDNETEASDHCPVFLEIPE